MKKRWLSAVLAWAMLANVFPAQAFAALTAGAKAGTEESVPALTSQTPESGTKADPMTVLRWEWADEQQLLKENVLYLPGVSEENPIDFDTVAAMLPQDIEAVLEDGAGEALAVEWVCAEFVSPAQSGSYEFSASLPDGYVLAKDADALMVTVVLGGAQHNALVQPAGDGTKNNPYQISSVDELYWFAALVNGTLTDGSAQNSAANAELTADIVVNTGVLKSDGTLAAGASSFRTWTPIGNMSETYTGVFDGAGHTISGLYLNDDSMAYAGLFGKVGENGAVQNVSLADSYIYGGYYVGGVCGQNSGEITNCHNAGTVLAKDFGAGGVCGYNTGTLENCHNTGMVRSEGIQTGGVCGYSIGTVENCVNSGAVQSTSIDTGGVCGYSIGTVENCVNSGTVQSTDFNTGGVCGTSNGTMRNCVNSGEVSNTDTTVGIVGGICGSSLENIENCINRGNVSGVLCVGGIAGENVYHALTSCYNLGTVTGTSKVGGVCGYNVYGTVENSYWLDTSCSAGVGSGSADRVEPKTVEQFAAGEVCWLLQSDQTSQVWGQEITKDTAPVLNDSTDVKVLKITVVNKTEDDTTDIPAIYANPGQAASGYTEGYDYFFDEALSRKINPESETYTADLTIYALRQTFAVVMPDHTYGEKLVPSVINNPGTGSVTYYYRAAGQSKWAEWPHDSSKIDAGTYEIYATVSTAGGDYTTDIVTFQRLKRPLTVEAQDATKVYGDADPADFVYIAPDLLEGDSLQGEMARDPGEDVGKYTIGIDSLVNPNYDITFLEGSFTITPKTLTPSIAGPVTKNYDGSTDVPEGSSHIVLEGVLDADRDAVTVTASCAYSDPNVGENKEVTFSNIQISGDKAKNYTLSTNTIRANIGTIMARPYLIEGADRTVTYTGEAINVEDLFRFEEGVSTPYETFLFPDTGLGVLNGNMLTVTKAGTFLIEIKIPKHGNYTEATASAVLTVNKAPVKAETVMTDYVYGETPSMPSLTANPGNGTVTYYYNHEGVNEQLEWKDITPTTLEAGNYEIHAVIGSTDLYESCTTEAVTFTVRQKDISGAVVTLGDALRYTGKEQTQTISGVKLGDLNVTYEVTGNTGIKAGDYIMTITGTGSYVGTLSAAYTIDPAAFHYGVADQTVKISTGLSAVNTNEDAAGVNGETVKGTLTWYEDAALTKALDKNYRFAGKEGEKVTLYWTFTPAEGQTNYVTEPLTGSTIFTLVEKPVPALTAKDLVKTYDGKTVTIKDLAGMLTADIPGTWSFAKGTPGIKNAGVYQVTLVYTPQEPEYYAVGTIQTTVIVEKADAIAAVDLSTNRVTKGEALPAVDVVYSGLIAGESLKLDSCSYTDLPADSNTAGLYVIGMSEDSRKDLEALDTAKNYTFTYEAATLSIVDVTVLPTPGELDGNFRLEMSKLTGVHENLLAAGYTSVEAIRQELVRAAAEKLPGIGMDDTVFCDLTLMQSKDNGKTWLPAETNVIPAGGITVTLPYPSGTNGTGYDYVVTHMATVAYNGLQPGNVESPAVTKTADGLQVKLQSLSPVAASLRPISEPDDDDGEDDVQPTPTPAPSAQPVPTQTTAGAAGAATGDDSQPMIWIFLMGVSVLAIVGIVVYRRKNVKK